MAARYDTVAKEPSARPSPGTPGRRARVGNQYFEVGKKGRKTGIELRDTGIRDSYGLEPVSGIFSSPGSIQRATYVDDDSVDMNGLSSDVPDLEETLTSRRTPRLPPARASTPRKSNITGSPRRQSSVKPQAHDISHLSPANALNGRSAKRVLDFHRQSPRQSIEAGSPFRPKNNLRRSGYGAQAATQRTPSQGVAPRPAMRDMLDSGRSKKSVPIQPTRHQTDEPPQISFNDSDDNEPFQDFNDGAEFVDDDDIEETLGMAGDLLQRSPNTPRRHPVGNKRQSKAPITFEDSPLSVPHTSSPARKRPRQSDPDDRHSVNHRTREPVSTHASPALSKKQVRVAISEEPERASVAIAEEPVQGGVAIDDTPLLADDFQGQEDEYSNESEGQIDLVPDPEPIENGDYSSPPAVRRPKAKAQQRFKGVAQRKSRETSSQPRRTQRADTISDDSDSDGSNYVPVRRQGSASNVSLRAMTPFEDAGENKTRSGRLVMKPLNYWEGETVVWKHGEVEGVVRASSVEPTKHVYKKRLPQKKKKPQRQRTNDLGDIDERDEELLPSDWEEEIGVLTGQIAEYDPDIGMGNDEYLETEDIAFAASAIITRQVQGASFNYAKIQTLPFFGSGIVEIPPGGIKATKNSRKMQMNFFVHKGKVQVTVSTPRQSDGAEPVSTTEFGITEGGAWIVPRGNNYTIRNLSTITTAYIFFSQGCEVEESTQLNGQAE